MTEAPSPSTPRIADSDPRNWVDAFAPAPVRPFLRLMRADRPIGVWLLLLPCLWGGALAIVDGAGSWPGFARNACLFSVGAFVMRSAGCAWNDFVDRDIDAQVARTAARPIPAGEISPRAALGAVAGLCLVGLAVLLQFNRFTILVGASSLALVAAYPFMKRVTWWPQAWLGLTFNWGVLVGYAAEAERLSAASLALYGAGVAWTLGYDTIYAHQDREDDALVGVKSSARALGDRTRPALVAFYGLTVGLAAAAVALAGAPAWTLLCLAPAGAHLGAQAVAFDANDGAKLLRLFKSNREAGLLTLAALLLAAGASGA